MQVVNKRVLCGYNIRQNRFEMPKKNGSNRWRTVYIDKDLIQQEAITIINIYAPNDRPPRYLKQKLK